MLKAASTHPITCTDSSCISLVNESDKKVFDDALSYIGKVASRISEIEGLESLNIQSSSLRDTLVSLKKYAGQKEMDDLQSALTLISNTAKSMIDQKEQVDLEFVEDMAKTMSGLQSVINELREMGYERLPSPGEPAEGGSPAMPAAPQEGEVQPQLSPEGGIPGVGSKVESGPAGGVGSVTMPTAKSKKQIKIALSMNTSNKKINLFQAKNRKK